MYQPETTYRIQFNKDFTFRDLMGIIPYLDKLGVKTIYAAPIFEAVPGSLHGYDGINPNSINPEIGTLEELTLIAEELKKRNMGWMQDFVPNHMAFTPQNPWLCDFLEKGKMSYYDGYFDKNPDEPLMVPFLADEPDKLLAEGALLLVFSRGKIQLRYHDNEYPLNYTAYYDILSHERFDGLTLALLREQIDILSQQTVKEAFNRQWQQLLNDLNAALMKEPVLKQFQEGLALISSDVSLMKQIMDLQFYRLCCWKETAARINYRRFFTINSLICMNMQNPEVFRDYHRLLSRLVKQNIIQAIRIDHIDGLYDPAGYLNDLRELVGDEVYITVEKILGKNERLSRHWPVQGTTGYDFLAQVNNVLTDPAADRYFADKYLELSGMPDDERSCVYRYKKQILTEHMQGELENLTRQFLVLPGLPPEFTAGRSEIKQALATLLIVCPVYRYYPERFPLKGRDREDFFSLIALAEQYGSAAPQALKQVAAVLSGDAVVNKDTDGPAFLHFWRRFMQLSGPLMAKGLEDTLMYNHQKYIVHNEVGDMPFGTGLTVEDFHSRMLNRQHAFPLSLNATATHDTKRGEDTRARLQVLADNPAEWFEKTAKWLSQAGRYGLSEADRYWVLQVVYGSIDLEEEDEDRYHERLSDYITKAVREAKALSDWNAPNQEYEQRIIRFAVSVADGKGKVGKDMRKYLDQKKREIVLRSLAQAALKCTCPGVADIYQGTEVWDLSFVDPDNRRPVNFNKLSVALEKVTAAGRDWAALMENIAEGAVKLLLLHHLLQLRRALPKVFSEGLYLPLKVSAGYLSFARRYAGDWVLVLIPIHSKRKEPFRWRLPEEAPLKWQDVFTGRTYDRADMMQASFAGELPVRVMRSGQDAGRRSAGVLLPLFSLASDFGIGDMGTKAFSFVTFLAKGGQKFWQLLPLNPVSAANSYSPYATVSAFAGDIRYIDPLSLEADGLLEGGAEPLPQGRQVAYEKAMQGRQQWLAESWERFKSGGFPGLSRAFRTFRDEATYWLKDYALYVVLKKEFGGQPWYAWPDVFRKRDPAKLERFRAQHADDVDGQCWAQFLFFRQWQRLRAFAAAHNLAFIGDLPFYLSADSADVWSHQHLFNITASGKPTAVAGVPPDYFSATGQLWGMPTYNWAAMAGEGYSWWLERLKHNVRLFDMVRLDHFRAFYDYWEVPGDADTATAGKWQTGPGDDLFESIRHQFPDMPFIAEDLGDIHQDVFDFKDRYNLPGMRVLQFGFSKYDSSLRDLPHNFDSRSVVYTGTHDNNTIAGWYHRLDRSARAALALYSGGKVPAERVADLMCRMAYASVAEMLIIPLQDLLSLGEEARINTPSTTEGNWLWRLAEGQISDELAGKLLKWVRLYNR